MALLSIIGTAVFVAIVVLSLLAVMDVLFFTPGRKKMMKSGAGARKLGGHRRCLRK
ncbi:MULTISPECIES: hypothetical protein [unclassified Paraburkholderia]|uniref:hypothetical protein n=1 Tax=unclassified Paraburkholderia TaxID=2615204 RepID=UPI000E38BC38|nr:MULTISPECIES: hypothetical protein [unclassified Paraburkholderia]REG52398.1 hypothetical protein B0G80_8945 [Paraburkholderia sp. BL6669N2]RKR36342.1 hypothetical protein B0G82_4381 [Paraburkholderia sp. BL17N1]TDY21298.1 hypothetical protein B0G81_1484 [Paraburkholderia sp. BL6665CI2N2]